jgi:hypothetical protein
MPRPTSPAALIVPLEAIERRILVLRGRRVMLDRDLAGFYGTQPRVLNQAVRRNKDRFPDDFMFQLTTEEALAVLRSRSQSVIMKRGQNVKYRPYAFTEHGAVMLANVLRSPAAVGASIQVVRAFVRLQQVLATHAGLARKIAALEKKVGKHDTDLEGVLAVLRQLVSPVARPRRTVGFVVPHKA